jgi:hypothetical protein
MPRNKEREEAPRTDLPPRKIPYDDDYFGSGEEEGVEREREASDGDDGGPKAADDDGGPKAA